MVAMALILVLSLGSSVFAGGGNGAPSGAHYNLNLIGVSNPKTADMTGNNGHRIFVNLTGNTKIWLTEGSPFAVLDANGTDGDGASFQLPNPDPTNSGTTVYSVFARALGKPGGSGDITTGATWFNPDTQQYETIYSVAVLELSRSKGQSKFENVSKELLYIYFDVDGDGKAEHYNLFNAAFENYFWSYNNQGLKVVQLRFFEGYPTTVPVDMPA